MTAFVTFFRFPVAVSRLVMALWNAWIVLFQVMQSVVHEAKQEAVEVIALLDDGASVMDAITSTSSLLNSAASPWQMLIISKASSFVFLLRLSKRRVLHLEVDERFIASKLEVIQTDLRLNVEHVSRLLQAPIGTHDTRLVRYTSMSVPYLWKEEQADPGPEPSPRIGEESEVAVPSTPVTSTPVSAGSERRTRRKKCVQLLAESALRRQSRMEGVPKRGLRESMGKKKALTNATNMGIVHAEGGTISDADADQMLDESGWETVTPKRMQTTRHNHAELRENLSVPDSAQVVSLRKGEGLRRKRGQFDLYSQSELSLMR